MKHLGHTNAIQLVRYARPQFSNTAVNREILRSLFPEGETSDSDDGGARINVKGEVREVGSVVEAQIREDVLAVRLVYKAQSLESLRESIATSQQEIDRIEEETLREYGLDDRPEVIDEYLNVTIQRVPCVEWIKKSVSIPPGLSREEMGIGEGLAVESRSVGFTIALHVKEEIPDTLPKHIALAARRAGQKISVLRAVSEGATDWEDGMAEVQATVRGVEPAKFLGILQRIVS